MFRYPPFNTNTIEMYKALFDTEAHNSVHEVCRVYAQALRESRIRVVFGKTSCIIAMALYTIIALQIE